METPETIKPPCQLVGEDGNVFNVIGRVAKALRLAGQKNRADEWIERAMIQESYGAVLALANDYVEVS